MNAPSSVFSNSTLGRRWLALNRFLRLPALQRGSLIRRKLPHWVQRRPVQQACHLDGDQHLHCDIAALTCVPHPTTGFGHRFSEWNTGLIVSRQLGVPYLHAGLGEGWDKELGLFGQFEDAQSYLRRTKRVVVRLPLVDWHQRPEALRELVALARAAGAKQPGAVIMLADGQCLFRQHDSAEELRRLYHEVSVGDADKRSPRAGAVRIAIHIRRGDVARMKASRQGDWGRRYVELDWFHAVASSILDGLDGAAREIEIFSQGARRDFDPLATLGALTFHLDADPVWSFHRMATADILVVSPSSYSFNAGLLSHGLKIARSPWWHEIPSAADWCAVTDPRTESAKIANCVRAYQRAERITYE
jgi:hypothetical protein